MASCLCPWCRTRGWREEMSSEEKATSTDSVGQSMRREPEQEQAQVKPISSLLWQEVSPNQWKTLKDKLQGSTALLFSFKHLSAYQLLMRLCCRIKLLSWPEGILQEQKAAELKGRSKEYTTQKPKGKKAAKKCREANWNIKQPTLVTGDISSNPGIMQAEPGPKYPRDLVLAGPQCCGR